MRSHRPIRLAALLLVATFGVVASAAPQAPKAPKAGSTTPVKVPKFKLKSLDGSQVSLDSLKGKIVVINFWGIWCTQCLREMPELQKLHEKYAGDPGVAVLTINTDEKPADVPLWMKEHGYTFPVLLENGYITKARIEVFPTSWFLDGEGRKVFEKVGFTEKLFDEFGSRVESMRASGGQ